MGYSQQRIADTYGVSHEAVRDILKGRNRPHIYEEFAEAHGEI